MAQDSRSSNQTNLDSVIHRIAEFRTLPGQTKGEFHLRDSYLPRYKPFYFRHNKAMLSAAIENVDKRLSSLADSSHIVVKKAPQLIPFLPPFRPILKLLYCDEMMKLMKQVLKLCCNSSVANKWSEDQIERVFFLILLGLDEDCRHPDSAYPFLSKFTKGENSVLDWMENLPKHHLVMESVKELYVYTLTNVRRVINLRNGRVEVNPSDPASTKSDMEAVATQQRKRKEQQELAQQRREQLMKKMAAMQKNFLAENDDFIKNMTPDDDDVQMDESLSRPSSSRTSKHILHLVGSNRAKTSTKTFQVTCILCQEDQEIGMIGGPLMVYSGFVQRSCMMSSVGVEHFRDEKWSGVYVESELLEGSYFNSCGHAMHYDCYSKFTSSRRVRYENLDRLYPGNQKPFFCPLCQQICNAALPVTPSFAVSFQQRHSDQAMVDISFHDWLEGIRYTMLNTVEFFDNYPEGNSKYKVVEVSIAHMKQRITSNIAEAFQKLYPVHYGSETADSAYGQLGQSMTEIMHNLIKICEAVGIGNAVPSLLLDRNSSKYFVEHGAANCNYTVLHITVAYSLECIEAYLRHSSSVKNLITGLPERCTTSLAAFIRCVAYQPASSSDQKHTVEILRNLAVQLLFPLFQVSKPDARLCDKHMLQIDMFSVLVQLTYCMPYLYLRESHILVSSVAPSCSSADHCLLRLTYTAHLVQIILTMSSSSATHYSAHIATSNNDLDRMVAEYRLSAGIIEDELPVTGSLLQNYLITASLPFLRCATLFYQALSDVNASRDGDIIVGSDIEFVQLTGLLNLPDNFVDLFYFNEIGNVSSSAIHSLLSYWCIDSRLESLLSKPEQLVSYPRSPRLLVSLPPDYTELLLQSTQFRCEKSLTSLAHGTHLNEHSQPVKCLICGAIVCSNSKCCQMRVEVNSSLTMSSEGDMSRGGYFLIGGANIHAMTCCAGTGVFLRLLDCSLLMLAGPFRGGCLKPAPYLDAYGETDEELRRGNPLYLSQASMDQIQEEWLLHRIPATVARQGPQGSEALVLN